MPADRTGGRIADNVLYYGDNLGILRHDLKDQSVDLVSLDLRFNSNASYCDALGFDKYADLTTEYQVKGEFADYGVRIDRELIAFIEVKRVATKLAPKHLRQVEMYAVNEGVEWVLLTNGGSGRCTT